MSEFPPEDDVYMYVCKRSAQFWFQNIQKIILEIVTNYIRNCRCISIVSLGIWNNGRFLIGLGLRRIDSLSL